MIVYLDLVILLNFLVDFLLIAGTNRLAGYPLHVLRTAAAAALGSLYAAVCMVPGFGFLGITLWRIIALMGISVTAFGWSRSSLRRGALFILLSMALGGIATAFRSDRFGTVLLTAAMLCGICMLGFRSCAGGKQYVRIGLRHGKIGCSILALRDTGNTLKDPVTGQSVLIVGADVAWELLGLTRDQLMSPIETLASCTVRGLRLMPYRSVGQPNGMLLALKLDEVTIDGKKTGVLVAFAPENIGGNEGYQALTGGVL